MNKKTYLKGAGVLLLTAVLLLSATAVTANTNQAATSLRSIAEPNNVVTSKPIQNTGRGILYDNGLPDGLNGLSCIGGASGLNREVVDDFVVPVEWQVTGGEYSVLTNSGGTSITGTIVEFFQDTGSGPSTTTYIAKTASITQQLTGNVYFNRPEIRVTCTFDQVTLAPGTWWVCFQTQYTENCFSLTATVQGSPVYCALPDVGYPRWTPGSTVFGGDFDLSWLLTGSAGGDTTAPVTNVSFSGTNPVTVTITATDDMSGVNHTYYNLDSAGYVEYAATPFDVSVPGNHTIFVYSVDKAGNSETPHSYTFTVAQPPITITIKKGLGITATIKNTGTTTLTNIPWTIKLTGGIIIIGGSKSGTIASLAPAATSNAKDFVLGFGKTSIVVTAGSVSATASGTVLLILVI